jgi:hypothetical protein
VERDHRSIVLVELEAIEPDYLSFAPVLSDVPHQARDGKCIVVPAESGETEFFGFWGQNRNPKTPSRKSVIRGLI